MARCIASRLVQLFSNRSQMTSKCDKIKKVVQEASVSLMFLPYFDAFCKVIFNWTDLQQQKLSMMTSSVCLSSNRTWVRTIQDACVIQLIIRLTPAIYLFPGQLAVAYVVSVYSWVNRGTVRIKCFAQNTTLTPRALAWRHIPGACSPLMRPLNLSPVIV